MELRVGGSAHADFVGSLGRKVDDARTLLSALESEPSSKASRDELRRHLHALGAGARLLQLEAMATAVRDALSLLDRSAQSGELQRSDLARLGTVIDELPSLGWGIPSRPTPDGGRDSTDDAAQGPIAALVVGGAFLADALSEDAGRGRAFECERTDDPQTGLELAQAFAPDVILIDADIPGAAALVEALLDDPMTEPVPIVVVGSFPAPEEPARFVALGVAKSLAKPAAPETIRRVCDEVVEVGGERAAHVTLGEPTLEQLADRLAGELRRALLDSVDPRARGRRIPLGPGTEVLGALWGAIARVQEIVVQKTRGAIRFAGEAPEGAIALAPWLHHEGALSERASERPPAARHGTSADVRLGGRRVVVADDDPGVTWFIADLLRTAGCEVHEALDGQSALDLAFRIQPELVVSDILMPGLDGFALSRALRRDVALRDTPVILLSWKEDLLQRVRELGASAAAYMRKESDSRAILARVREVLLPRARIEMRLRSEGEVRGRLDGLSARWLLELVCAIRKDARVAVRDATSLYEIEIRGGVPRKATRTAADGGYQSGGRAMGSLLVVGAGRFIVSPSTEPVRGDLTGTLPEQLAHPIALARGSLVATTGPRMMDVERISFDGDVLLECVRATPDPARVLIRQLEDGLSPREVILGGEVSPSLLEDVLADLASRGAVQAVEGAAGEDLLTPAVDAALAVLRGEAKPRPAPPEPRPSGASFTPRPSAARLDVRRPRVPVELPKDDDEDVSYPVLVADADRSPRPADAQMPSSLEDALMREISERSVPPATSRAPDGHPPPIIEPAALRRRSSNPPEPVPSSHDAEAEAVVPSASSDPIAAVPAIASAEGAPPVEPDDRPGAPLEGPYLSPFEMTAAPTPPVGPDALLSPERQAQLPPDAHAFAPSQLEATAPLPVAPAARRASTPAPAAERTAPLRTSGAIPPAAEEEPPPSAVARPRAIKWWAVVSLALLLGVAGGAIIHVTGNDSVPELPAAPPRPPTVPPSPVAPTAAVTTAAAATAAQPSDDVPPGAEVPAGYGLVEVKAPEGARVRIDGAIVGAGPIVSTVVAPGFHEVRIEQSGQETKEVIEARAGKMTRVPSSPAPPAP